MLLLFCESSLFFAQRCHRLVSVESDPSWFETMKALLRMKNITNVDYRFRGLGDEYVAHPDLPDHSFDLVIVDGISRDTESIVALRKVKPGGYVFYDNSDVPWPGHAAARSRLVEAAAQNGVAVFNDFYPFQVQVNESILARIAGDPIDSLLPPQ